MNNDEKNQQTQQPISTPASTVFAEEKTTDRRVEPVYTKPVRRNQE